MTFATGIEGWTARGRRRWRGARIGLLSHAAAVGADGVAALDRLVAQGELAPSAVFTPEHGYWGAGGAGEPVRDQTHPIHGLPLYSLYGERPAPTPGQWRALDALLVDLQDIGVRCYTYVSTLRDVLESAAVAGQPVIVADRPSPLAAVVDGPMLDPAMESFVAHVPAPFVYGMTIGETARWLRAALRLDLDLHVLPMRGYRADGRRPPGMPWVPPSPGLRAWESAWGYPVGVFSEALPLLRADRGGPLSFQVIAVSRPWKPQGGGFPRLGRNKAADFQALENAGSAARPAGMTPEEIVAVWEALCRLEWPGARVEFHGYDSGGEWCAGARMVIHDPGAWRPAEAAVAVLAALQESFGAAALWEAPGARPDFFDRLWGTPGVRGGLGAGRAPRAIVRDWHTSERRAFDRARERALLYER
jgi:uncharacterized protein YbbC (DUF1343 family)